MKLTIQTDYALRTLMFLAARCQRCTVSEVAGAYGISRNHVAKVVNLLARAGYVRSIRGIGGGIELALDPADISIGKVVATMENDTHLLSCVGSDDSCVISSFCKLKVVLAEAERIQQSYLGGISLADVTPTPRQISQIQ